MFTPSACRFVPAFGLVSAFLLTALLGACSIFSQRPATPISEVVNLSKGGQSDRVIDRINASKTAYALRGSDFGKLADAGVPDKVLDYLQQSFYNDVDLLTRYWVLGESLGGGNTYYPQPVDLSTLSAGGNGMADAENIGRYSDFSKPAGLPNWVTALPGRMNALAITVDQVAQMVKEGKSADTAIAEIDNSRVHDYITTTGISHISTHYAVGLTGSALAQLHKDRVPDPVLDALQRKYLAEFIEFNRFRYQSWGKGNR